MESECAPSTGQQPEHTGAEEGAPTAARQSDPTGVEQDASVSSQQPQLVGAERGSPTVPQEPEPMLEEGAPASGHLLGPPVSMFASSVSGRSRSAPPVLETQPEHQSPLPLEGIQGSSGSSSGWISNATRVTYNSSTASSDGVDVRNTGHLHTDGTKKQNWESDIVPSVGALGPDKSRQLESEQSLSTCVTSGHVPTQTDQPYDSNSKSAPSSRKGSIVTSTSSASLYFSTSSNSVFDPTKPDIFGLRRSSVLDTDEDEADDTSLTSLMNMVEVLSDYFDDFEPQQTEEYIVSVIRNYVDIASSLIADLRVIAASVFDSSDVAESPGMAVQLQTTDEDLEGSEESTSLESRLQAVMEYESSATDDTTEKAIAEMINREYNAERRMAESGTSEEASSSDSPAVSSDVGHDLKSQEGAVSTGETIFSVIHLAKGGVKKRLLELLPTEEADSLSQTASGSEKQETFQPEEAMVATSESIRQRKGPSERSSAISSSNSDKDSREYSVSSHYEQIYPESERQKKVRKSRQEAAVFKVFSMAQVHVYAIRTMNCVMLRCLKTVIGIVKQALEANSLARRAVAEAAALRSAGTSADYVAAVAEAATAASQCAETAVREIEHAVQLHKSVVKALKWAERALYSIRTERCDGADLIRHLVAGVDIIEAQVIRTCFTYLDKAKGKDSDSPLVLPATGGIHGTVISMAYENADEGPSDVLQALLWASQSSVNAMEMILKGLEDFSISKVSQPRSSEKK